VTKKPPLKRPPTEVRVTLSDGQLDHSFNAVLIRAGLANKLNIPARVLEESAELFNRVPVYADHAPGHRSVRDLVGLVTEAKYDPDRQAIVGTVKISQSAQWLADLVSEFHDQQYFGLSADLWLRHTAEGLVTAIVSVNSVDIVMRPAAGGQFLHQEETTVADEQFAQDAETPPPAGDQDLRRELGEMCISLARVPETVRDTLRATFQTIPINIVTLRQLITAQEGAWSDLNARAAITAQGLRNSIVEPVAAIEAAFAQLMGIGDDPAYAGITAHRLSGIRELYDTLTGDWERRGLYHSDRVQFANATTTTMAEAVRNVLNKMLLRAFNIRPQWWSPVAHEEDFASLQTVRWVTLGGVANLDTVSEGAAYTEKTWDDYAETADWVKKGNYIGLTLEMIDRDDVAAVKALPRKLGLAAWRTLSSAVSALFTDNSGTGPTLADTKALFHADHGNLGTTALSANAWGAIVVAMFKQAEYHSSKRIGLRPRFCLVPIDLNQTALTIFTSDLLPGSANNDRNIYRDSANVIVVPEWTDVTDYAAAADPNDLEGVCIAYRYGRTPELYIAGEETMGSMFTNDEMRIKVRFIYAVGIGDYRALYKANVAG